MVEVEASQEAMVEVQEVEEGDSRELETGSVQTRESEFKDMMSLQRNLYYLLISCTLLYIILMFFLILKLRYITF